MRGQLALLAIRGLKGHRGQMGHQDLKGQMVSLEKMGSQDILDRGVNRVSKVKLALQDPWE